MVRRVRFFALLNNMRLTELKLSGFKCD